jgi:hypothetical protein
MLYEGGQLTSEGQFYLGLALIAAAIVAAIAGYTEIRYDVTGLQEIHGRVIEIDTTRSRMQGYQLHITLATDSGPMRLKQQSVGGYSSSLSSGQDIRAWIGPRDGEERGTPVYPVWQIERGGKVVMPALDVGKRVLNGFLTLCGGLLIPLLGGTYLVGRNLMRQPPDGGAQA